MEPVLLMAGNTLRQKYVAIASRKSVSFYRYNLAKKEWDFLFKPVFGSNSQ
jgi:hypothetical protein